MKKVRPFEVFVNPALQLLSKAVRAPPRVLPALLTRQFYQRSRQQSLQQFETENNKFFLLNNGISKAALQKIFQEVKPDFVLLQFRPCLFSQPFSIYPADEKGQFSNAQYLKQVQLTTAVVSSRVYQASQLLDGQTASLVGKLASQSKLLSCALPEITVRQLVANSLTLMELKDILAETSKQLHPDYTSGWLAARRLYPQFFLKHQDLYAAALISELDKQNSGKTMLALLGEGQPAAVRKVLEQSLEGSVQQRALPNAPTNSVVRDVTGAEIIEKHSILDVLDRNYLQKFGVDKLRSTPKLIEFYGEGQEEVQQLREVHLACMVRHRQRQLQLVDAAERARRVVVEGSLRQW